MFRNVKTKRKSVIGLYGDWKNFPQDGEQTDSILTRFKTDDASGEASR